MKAVCILECTPGQTGDLAVGFTVTRGQPGPGGEVFGPVEPVHVPDLGDDDGGQDRADAVTADLSLKWNSGQSYSAEFRGGSPTS